MIGFSSDENFSGCPKMQVPEDAPSLKALCAVTSREFHARRKMRLQRRVISQFGGHMSAEVLIKLNPGHRLNAGKLSTVLRHTCSDYFRYLLSTSHSKTLVSELTDLEGCTLGEIIVSVRPSQVAAVPIRAAGALSRRTPNICVSA